MRADGDGARRACWPRWSEAPETAGVRRRGACPRPSAQQVLVEWNATAAEYPDERCVHELFEAQVERAPDAVAVVVGEERRDAIAS